MTLKYFEITFKFILELNFGLCNDLYNANISWKNSQNREYHHPCPPLTKDFFPLLLTLKYNGELIATLGLVGKTGKKTNLSGKLVASFALRPSETCTRR